MSKKMKLGLPIAVAALVIAVFVSAGAIAGSTPTVPDTSAKPQGVGPLSAANFEVFGRSRTASDELSIGNAASEGQRPRQPFGIDAEESHRAPISSARGDLWIAPAANDYVCVLFAELNARSKAVAPGFSCSAATGGPEVSYSRYAAKGFNIYGSAPNGYTSVEVTLKDDSTVVAEIADNLYGLNGSSEPVKAVFSGKSGSKVVDLGR